VAIARKTCAADVRGEIQCVRQLLEALELGGLLEGVLMLDDSIPRSDMRSNRGAA
jgi:hypothetical protein